MKAALHNAPCCILALALLFVSPEAFANDFNGYPCTSDCSGHEAGYEWAERHDIDDESDCGGNSNSVIEGCQSYIEEQEQLNNDDDADE